VRELRNRHAATAGVELPSVVKAFEPPIVQLSVGEPCRAVRTPVLQTSERSLAIAKEDEPLAVNRKAGRPIGRQIFDERDGIPGVPPDQQTRFSLRRASTVKKPGK
jgi:hypothetical protein